MVCPRAFYVICHQIIFLIIFFLLTCKNIWNGRWVIEMMSQYLISYWYLQVQLGESFSFFLFFISSYFLYQLIFSGLKGNCNWVAMGKGCCGGHKLGHSTASWAPLKIKLKLVDNKELRTNGLHNRGDKNYVSKMGNSSDNA